MRSSDCFCAKLSSGHLGRQGKWTPAPSAGLTCSAVGKFIVSKACFLVSAPSAFAVFQVSIPLYNSLRNCLLHATLKGLSVLEHYKVESIRDWASHRVLGPLCTGKETERPLWTIGLSTFTFPEGNLFETEDNEFKMKRKTEPSNTEEGSG